MRMPKKLHTLHVLPLFIQVKLYFACHVLVILIHCNDDNHVLFLFVYHIFIFLILYEKLLSNSDAG